MSNDLTSSWEYPFAKKIEALEKRIAELESKIADIRDIAENAVEINMGNFNDDDVSEQNNALIEIWQILNIPEGGGVCQNCMGEGIDLIQSGRMVIKEKCTSCNGTGRSDGGADD